MPFNTTINTELLTTYIIKKFIPTLENELQLMKFTTPAMIPPGQGVTARWVRFANPGANTTALTEGTTTGGATTITTTGVTATVAEYGQFVIITSLAEMAAVKGSRDALSDRLAYSAALTLDTLLRDGTGGLTGFIDTTVDFYCSTATNGGGGTAATPTAGSAAALIGAAKLLRDNNAQGFRGVGGHPEGHLAAVVSPKFELDMVTEDASTNSRMTWAEANTDVPGQAGQGKWVNGFMGSVYGTACYRTQNTTNTTVTNTAENNWVIADGGVGSLKLLDADPQIFINTPSAGDVGNPYRNRSTAAWHAFFSCALIDANRVVRVYSLAT